MKPSDIKSLKVGAHTYKVIKPYRFTEETGRTGDCTHPIMEIRIAEVTLSGVRQADSEVEYVFWHEVLHAIDSRYNGLMLREEDITRIAEGLTQVLYDNFDIKPKEK